MGLLDNPEMAFAMGLLDASGPSRMPVSFGQAMNAGYGQMQAARQASQAALAAQALEMQMQEMKRKQDAEQARMAQLKAFRDQLPPNLQNQFDIDPESVIKALNARDEEYTLSPGAARFRGSQQIAAVPAAKKPAPTAPAIVQEINAWSQMPPGPGKDLLGNILRSKAQAQQAPAAYYTPIPTVDGLASFNNRTGQLTPIGNGKIMKPSDSPELQGRITAAKTTGEATAKRTMNISGLDATITAANDILTGKTGNLPTGSSIGTAVDTIGGVFGVNPKGATEATKLKALAGALTAKMPRMEGPQSDKDVQLYREMAADVGNSMLPRERRIAALQVVRSLFAKYEQPAKTGAAKFLGFE